MGESTYYFILLFMGLIFVTPAFAVERESTQVCEVRQNEKDTKELFEALFGHTSKIGEQNLMPEDVKILDVTIQDGNLSLNLSKEIKNYGGTLTEQWIVDRILSVGFSIPNVESVSVFIEGKKDYLPEGTIIESYDKEKWLDERMNSEWSELTKENTKR